MKNDTHVYIGKFKIDFYNLHALISEYPPSYIPEWLVMLVSLIFSYLFYLFFSKITCFIHVDIFKV